MESLSGYVKYALGLMSDPVFLGSIEYVDFKNRYVSVKRGYWNLFFTMINDCFKLYSVGQTLRQLKLLWLERLETVTPSSLHRFFLGRVRGSYMAFSDVFSYVMFAGNTKILKTAKIRAERNSRRFELKAAKYREFLSRSVPHDDVDPEIELIENVDHQASFVEPVVSEDEASEEDNNMANDFDPSVTLDQLGRDPTHEELAARHDHLFRSFFETDSIDERMVENVQDIADTDNPNWPNYIGPHRYISYEYEYGPTPTRYETRTTETGESSTDVYIARDGEWQRQGDYDDDMHI